MNTFKEESEMTTNIGSARALAEAVERIEALEASLKTARVDAVREVLGLLEVDASEFYYNEPNDYGSITAKFWTGKGDPWELYRGPEIQSNFRDGRRGTGRYPLNEAALLVIVEQLDRARTRQAKG